MRWDKLALQLPHFLESPSVAERESPSPCDISSTQHRDPMGSPLAQLTLHWLTLHQTTKHMDSLRETPACYDLGQVLTF